MLQVVKRGRRAVLTLRPIRETSTLNHRSLQLIETVGAVLIRHYSSTNIYLKRDNASYKRIGVPILDPPTSNSFNNQSPSSIETVETAISGVPILTFLHQNIQIIIKETQIPVASTEIMSSKVLHEVDINCTTYRNQATSFSNDWNHLVMQILFENGFIPSLPSRETCGHPKESFFQSLLLMRESVKDDAVFHELFKSKPSKSFQNKQASLVLISQLLASSSQNIFEVTLVYLSLLPEFLEANHAKEFFIESALHLRRFAEDSPFSPNESAILSKKLDELFIHIQASLQTVEVPIPIESNCVVLRSINDVVKQLSQISVIRNLTLDVTSTLQVIYSLSPRGKHGAAVK